MSRVAQVGLLLALSMLLSGPLTSAAGASRVDRRNVKQLWDTLTQEEQESYKRLVARSRATAFGSPLQLQAGDICQNAVTDESNLPRTVQGTTDPLPPSMFRDDYTYGADCGCNILDPDQPNCGGFNSESGVGPDIAYRVVVDQDCIVEATLVPTAIAPEDDDLALYITTDCDDIGIGCIGAEDFGGVGVTEDVTFAAESGTPYFVVVDGFMGDLGPFELTIEEAPSSTTGCALLPVELMRGGVD